MKKNLFTLAISLATLASFGQSPRLCLYEEFTGETCPPCASANPPLNALLAQPTNTPKVVPIKWQVPIPSAPSKTWSLYQTNKAEINWRLNYGYGINSAPSGRMDGQNPTVFGANSDHPGSLNSAVITTAQSYTSAFNITMARAWTPGCTAINLTVNIQATANFTATGNLVFRTVMVERLIQFSVQPGTNGEKDFEDVAIKSFPTLQGGIPMMSTWTTGQSQTFTLNCPVPSYTRKKEQIAFVGFIQDDGNRKVAQAVRTATDAVPAEAIAALGASVDITCSNTISPKVTVRNDGISAITNLTLTPHIDGVAGTPLSWSGNLAIGASTDVVLGSIQTATTVGSHLFEFDVTMNVPLYNLTINRNKTTYLVATSYQGTPVSEGFPAAVFPPAGWTAGNTDDGPSWSRFVGGGAYGLSTESCKYDFYSNTVIGDADELILPPIDLSTSSGTPMLSMDIAYAQRNANSTDELQVYASTDCGVTWTSVFQQSGSTLATFGPVGTSPYVPDQFDVTHWKTESVNLPGFVKPNVLVKLVAVNGGGNNLFIDNINLSQVVGIRSVSKTSPAVSVYPNPAKDGVVNIKIQSNGINNALVTVVNALGQQVYERQTLVHEGSSTLRVNVAGFVPGIYSVVVKTDKDTSVNKLIISNK